jgi:hypothetical protein
MISFMISVVPPKTDWTRMSRQTQPCAKDPHKPPAGPPNTRLPGSTGGGHPADPAGHHPMRPSAGRHQFRTLTLRGTLMC